jgi:hypothetical protein
MLAVAEDAATIETSAVDPLVHTPTCTTLYNLIEAVQEQVVPEDDAVVIAAVAHLCKAGYVKYLRVSKDCEVA